MDEERLRRIEEAIGIIVDAVRTMSEKIGWFDEQLDQLTQSKVFDRLDSIESDFGSMVGGLNDIIDTRRKGEYREGLRSKHPEFSRYEPIGSRFGLDVYGIAADKTFGLPEEEAEQAIISMLEELKSKFDDLLPALESLKAHEEGESPAEEKAEQEGGPDKGPAIEVEVETTKGGPDPKIIEMARRYKGARVG